MRKSTPSPYAFLRRLSCLVSGQAVLVNAVIPFKDGPFTPPALRPHPELSFTLELSGRPCVQDLISRFAPENWSVADMEFEVENRRLLIHMEISTALFS
jgi:hypothetical protein